MMALSTIGLDGYPDSRYLLLKEVKDGQFIFFTNYNSQKGQEISHNNKVSMLFYWPCKYWSIRIQGDAEKISAEESDQYFTSRPLGSQASAIVSNQSHVIPDDKEGFVISILQDEKRWGSDKESRIWRSHFEATRKLGRIQSDSSKVRVLARWNFP